MPRLTIRGLDAKALYELKAWAVEAGVSVNTLVLRLIEQGLSHNRSEPRLRRHDDLDELAGRWSANDVAEFDRVTAAMSLFEPSARNATRLQAPRPAADTAG